MVSWRRTWESPGLRHAILYVQHNVKLLFNLDTCIFRISLRGINDEGFHLSCFLFSIASKYASCKTRCIVVHSRDNKA